LNLPGLIRYIETEIEKKVKGNKWDAIELQKISFLGVKEKIYLAPEDLLSKGG
jgi:hypothetical protein